MYLKCVYYYLKSFLCQPLIPLVTILFIYSLSSTLTSQTGVFVTSIGSFCSDLVFMKCNSWKGAVCIQIWPFWKAFSHQGVISPKKEWWDMELISIRTHIRMDKWKCLRWGYFRRSGSRSSFIVNNFAAEQSNMSRRLIFQYANCSLWYFAVNTDLSLEACWTPVLPLLWAVLPRNACEKGDSMI